MRHRILILIFTSIHTVLLIITYVLDQKKSNWLCGPSLLLIGFLMLLFQIILVAGVWNRRYDKGGIISTIISGMLFITFILGFWNFLTKCS